MYRISRKGPNGGGAGSGCWPFFCCGTGGSWFQADTEVAMLVAVAFFVVWAARVLFANRRDLRKRLAEIPAPGLWLVVSAIAIVWGADLEWPGDNWDYWSRPKRASDLSEIQGIGEFLNLIWYHCVPDRFWRLEPVLPTLVGTLLILSQVYRLGWVTGCRGWFLNAAVVFSFLSWGVYGFPLLRQVILGRAAFGFAVQIATLVELLIFLKRGDRRSIPWIIMGFVIAAAANDQSLLLLLVGSVGIGAWWMVERFGWRRCALGGLVTSMVFSLISDFLIVPWVLSTEDIGVMNEEWIGRFVGFDFFSADVSKLWQLPLGSWGVFGIVATAFLICRKNPVGFICATCFLVLLFPPSARLYCALLLEYDHPKNFNRLLLVLPWSLPVMLALWELGRNSSFAHKLLEDRRVVAGIVLLGLFLGLSPERPIYGKNAHYLGRRTAEGGLHFYDDLVQYMDGQVDRSTLIISDKTTQYAISAAFGTDISYPGIREKYADISGAPVDWEAEPDQLVTLLREYDYVVAVRSFEGGVSPRRSLMTEASENVPPLGLWRNLACIPEVVEKLDRIAARENWRVEEVAPNFRVYRID